MDVNCMSVKELKEIIVKAGLSTNDCVEKNDLRVKAKEALKVLEVKSQVDSSNLENKKEMKDKTTANTGHSHIETIDMHFSYDCKVVSKKEDSSGPCDGVIFILHGYGATNADFVTLAQEALKNKCKYKYLLIFLIDCLSSTEFI